jgi:hypothetical protein
MKTYTLRLVVVLFLVFTLGSYVNAQDVNRVPPLEIFCGQSIEGEFVEALEERNYALNATAGTTVNISVNAISERPQILAMVMDPSNTGIAISDGDLRYGGDGYSIVYLNPQLSIDNLVLPASGVTTIRLVNFGFAVYNFARDQYGSPSPGGGVGAYTLSITCIDRDGNPITGSEDGPEGSNGGGGTTEINLPDLSTVGVIPLSAGMAMGGNTASVNAYTIVGDEGQRVRLDLRRSSGNLNLGLVILAPSGEVLGFSTLVRSVDLSLEVTLPVSGQYTVGVFVVNLAPPTGPEPTAFQLQATLSG